MKWKSALVFFLILFVRFSLYPNELKRELTETFKSVLTDQKNYFPIFKNLKSKHFEDALLIDAEFERIKNSLNLYIALLNLYSCIKPDCVESKKDSKEYLKLRFHLEAESKKQIATAIQNNQSHLKNSVLKSYAEKCSNYNIQISLLLIKFK